MRLNASAGHTIKFSGRTWYEIQIRERKGPSQGVIQKGEPHERNPCAPKSEERTLEETSRQEECARKGAWDLARKIHKFKAEDETMYYSLVEIEGTGASLQKHRRAYVCGWFGSFNAHAEQEGFKLKRNGNFGRSRTSTTIVTANGEVQTNDEAQVHGDDLDLFVTVQLLDETPAVLSHGKLCSEHGCSYEWKKRRNSTTDQKWEDNYLYNGQLCASCRTSIVIIFQQQLGFYIETKGSVKFFRWIGNIIRSIDDS